MPVALHTKRRVYYQNAFAYHVYQRCLCFILKGAVSRITHLEKAGKFFQVCYS